MPALAMFSKMLQDLSLPECCRAMKGLGLDGIDLTVRPAGYVLPENVAKALPDALKVAKDAGLSIPMITTGILKADEPHAAAILDTAASLGIRYIKLGYWMAPAGKVRASIDQARSHLDALERLAESRHLTLGIHNHSGPGYVTCQPLTVLQLLQDRNPETIASYFDPGHAAVEGGSGGWKQSLELLAPRIRMLAVKDFGWVRNDPSKKQWSEKLFPLNEGLVSWPDVFRVLKGYKFHGPISLHSEYKGPHSYRDLNTPALLDQTAKDLTYLRPLL